MTISPDGASVPHSLIALLGLPGDAELPAVRAAYAAAVTHAAEAADVGRAIDLEIAMAKLGREHRRALLSAAPLDAPAAPRAPKSGLTRDAALPAFVPLPRPPRSGAAATALTYLVAIAAAVTVGLTMTHGLTADFAALTHHLP